ncbi:sigma-70 family RNA polymerase sigma factor [Terrisporobacter sp.]|uniref:sigma-70 family RNA polymerase sigma factor n=1 Tax=Terrisporobacter sp. TaxID=1965305 RepID=UPI00260196DF|nr:sigma-70 family RNA polymerase sigma factor [Terrisporobacter sp.]
MGEIAFEKATKGNKKALRELIKMNSKFIYKLAYIHTKYEDDATIIMKNTILYIYDNIHKMSKVNNLKNYIMRITIKHINEYIEEFGIVDFEESNSDFINNSKIDLYKSIDILEVHLKNVVVLRYFYNLSYKEISEILSINESTVKMYLRKSLKILKEELKEDL